MRTRTYLWTAALALAPFVAVAGPAVAATTGQGSASPAASGSAAPKAFHETPDQRDRRHKYVKDTADKTRAIVRKDNKAFTKDEGTLITEHWRRSMRALRIRDVAEDDNDTAVVGRVDTALKKIDDKFFAALTTLNAKAPPRPPTPTLTTPTSLALSAPFDFKFAPVPGSEKRFCAVWQTLKGHELHHWLTTVKASDECVLPATDPQHAKFEPGKAHLHSWVMVGGNWSDMANIDLDLTGAGGAAPVASGGAK
jgi:hypothetical protein